MLELTCVGYLRGLGFTVLGGWPCLYLATAWPMARGGGQVTCLVHLCGLRLAVLGGWPGLSLASTWPMARAAGKLTCNGYLCGLRLTVLGLVCICHLRGPWLGVLGS